VQSIGGKDKSFVFRMLNPCSALSPVKTAASSGITIALTGKVLPKGLGADILQLKLLLRMVKKTLGKLIF
jgi:hypothetical protein